MEDNRFTSDRVRFSLLIAKWIIPSMKLCLLSAFSEWIIWIVKRQHITPWYPDIAIPIIQMAASATSFSFF